ncbi:glycoside hydrolase superfamily [Schizophyllum fasciatum]
MTRLILMGIFEPSWMKVTGTMKGGVFKDEYQNAFAQYLLKCLQAFKDKGVNAYAISIQNEPENNNDSLPSTVYTAAKKAAPVQLLDAAPDAFASVAFHCYIGTIDQMADFYKKNKGKEIYMTDYALVHLSKAILPKDSGGPFGKRIGVSVTGDQSCALVVSAFITERGVTNEPARYSLVVLNYYDTDGMGNADFHDVEATISFKGKRAKYTFPVGVSTLFWYA